MATSPTRSVDERLPAHVAQQLEGLRESQLHQEYLVRLQANRNIILYITGASETGVGKTTLAFALALLWDIWGWTAWNATLDPREYVYKYDRVPPGSVLMLDEAEQATDKRRAMSQENLEVGYDFATKRYRQVFGILTLPTRSWLDDRVGDHMADYWIQAQETDKGEPKGEATVYRLKDNEHYETTYTKRTETISWPVMDWHSEFRKLEQKKVDRMEGVEQSKYIHRDEFEEAKKNFWNKATKKTRYHIVKAMVEHGMTQTETAEILQKAEHVEGLTRQRVGQLVNTESFEEAYST